MRIEDVEIMPEGPGSMSGRELLRAIRGLLLTPRQLADYCGVRKSYVDRLIRTDEPVPAPIVLMVDDWHTGRRRRPQPVSRPSERREQFKTR